MKTCIALRHVPFESLGQLEPCLVTQGFAINVVDVPVSGLDAIAIKNADLLVVLGGPISVYEEHLYPWLLDELRLIEWRLSYQKPTLGLCLGAQFMARALGARVYPGVQKEIGWSPLTLTEFGKKSFLCELKENRVLHWHGDTFDLPSGATLLASTSITPHQAFQYGNHAIALQFHLEVTADQLEAWYVGHTCELSHWGQLSIPELRALGQKQGPLLAPYAALALSKLLHEIQM